jgi:hypothetical protein
MAGARDTFPESGPDRPRVRSASLALALLAAALASPSATARPGRASGEPASPPPYLDGSTTSSPA